MRALDNFNSLIIEPRPVMLDADHMGRLSILASEPLHGAARLSTLLGKGARHVVVVPSHEMPADVVNIGSDVSYRDEITGRVHSVRLAMPQDADIRIRRVSVLTPVGTALIGRAEGAIVDCEFPAGTLRRLAILRVSKNGPRPQSAAIFRRESVRRKGDATSAANRAPHVASERGDLERMSFIQRAIIAPLRRRRRRHKQIAQLESLSDHLLDDIGLSRAAIIRAVDAMIAGDRRRTAVPSLGAFKDQLRQAA